MADVARGFSDKFQLRLAYEKPAEGLIEMAMPKGSIPEVVYVSDEAIVTGKDVEKVTLQRTDDKKFLEIGIKLSKPGAKAMAEATAANLRNHIAVLCEGKLLMAPRVRAKISEEMVLSGATPKVDVIALFEAIIK